MTNLRLSRIVPSLVLILAVSACSDNSAISKLNPFGKKDGNEVASAQSANTAASGQAEEKEEKIWDLFENRDDTSSPVRVNRFIWKASLEVLDFLPIENIDPFTGVIVTGWGTPPGGSTQYRAHVVVNDPALDSRSLRLSLMTRSGPVDPDTVESVENSILSRARQLRNEELDF